jgi:hypothetical protein
MLSRGRAHAVSLGSFTCSSVLKQILRAHLPYIDDTTRIASERLRFVSKSVHGLVTKAINGLVDKLALIAFAASPMAEIGKYIDKPRVHIVSLPVFCWKMYLENEYQLLNPEFK